MNGSVIGATGSISGRSPSCEVPRTHACAPCLKNAALTVSHANRGSITRQLPSAMRSWSMGSSSIVLPRSKRFSAQSGRGAPKGCRRSRRSRANATRTGSFVLRRLPQRRFGSASIARNAPNNARFESCAQLLAAPTYVPPVPSPMRYRAVIASSCCMSAVRACGVIASSLSRTSHVGRSPIQPNWRSPR